VAEVRNLPLFPQRTRKGWGTEGYCKNENGPGAEIVFYLAMNALAGGPEFTLHGP
jgi:hypothetical protein